MNSAFYHSIILCILVDGLVSTEPRQREFQAGNLKRDLKDLPAPLQCSDVNKPIYLIDDKGFKLAVFCSKSLEKVIKTKIKLKSNQHFFSTLLYFKSDRLWFLNENDEEKPLIHDHQTFFLEENGDANELIHGKYFVVFRRNIEDELEHRLKTIAELCPDPWEYINIDPEDRKSENFQVRVDDIVVEAKFRRFDEVIDLGKQTISTSSGEVHDTLFYSVKENVFMINGEVLMPNWDIRQVTAVEPGVRTGDQKTDLLEIPFVTFEEILKAVTWKMNVIQVLAPIYVTGDEVVVGALNVKEKTFLKFSSTEAHCGNEHNLIEMQGLFHLPNKRSNVYTERIYYDGVEFYEDTLCKRQLLPDGLFIKAFDHKMEVSDVIIHYSDFEKFREYLGSLKPKCKDASSEKNAVQYMSFEVDVAKYYGRMLYRYHCKDHAFYIGESVHVLKIDKLGNIDHLSFPAIVFFADSREFAADNSFLDDVIAIYFESSKITAWM